MDLEGFDHTFDSPKEKYLLGKNAWSRIDHWFTLASRSARRMDLLGDYAGNELFCLDGEALFQMVLDDPLLYIGREGCTFQILHAYLILERLLEEFNRRHANFEIVFWDNMKYLSIQMEKPRFEVASRALARSMLFNHLLSLPFTVRAFDDLRDANWIQYAIVKKPMFVMTSAGDSDGPITKTAVTFSQRAFMLNLLSSGISVTLLKGSDFRDSKVMSFVYEPLRGAGKVLEVITKAIDLERQSLYTRFKTMSSDEAVQTGSRTMPGLHHYIPIILTSIEEGVPPEAIYLFITHMRLIPSLTVYQRAQSRIRLPPALENVLLDKFLSRLFFQMAGLIASSEKQILDIDGTLYSTLVAFTLTHAMSISEIIGDALENEVRSLWTAGGGPPLDFDAFRTQYLPRSGWALTTSKPDRIEPKPLLPFTNSIFDHEFSIFDGFVDIEKEQPCSPILQGPTHNVQWVDDQHWHSQRRLLPRTHAGIESIAVEIKDPKKLRKIMRANQHFMASLQDQAATLTGAFGAILQQTVIISVKDPESGKGKRAKANTYSGKNSLTLTKKEKLKRQIAEEKLAASKMDADIKWKSHLSTISKQSLSTQLESISTLLVTSSLTKESHIVVEMYLYRIQVELQTWIVEDNRASPAVRDRYTVLIMRLIQDILRKGIMTPSVSKALKAVLVVLGFESLVDSLLSSLPISDHARNFRFMKLVRSETGVVLPEYAFMSITEDPIAWQLRLFGDFMDRSMDSAPDPRVGFEPDAWQRRVLDGIDKGKSLLVVAPTSAGKTFISFYAMERVLRESNDGILVYIAPTKALVTQISAEIHARFKKDLNGKSCWAIHTRDYRINDPLSCQILVTVPEVLAIMLLSPSMAHKWTPRIRRIVFDEIHTIGQQEGGAVWEQNIIFAPCPVIGLSATIGSPESFSNWLGSVQRAHGFDYEFIQHPYRYSHLRKFLYITDGEGKFENLGNHCATDRMQFMHPITMLLFGAKTLPADLSLEAADTLSLYDALSTVLDEKDIMKYNIRTLKPTIFFANRSGLLRQKDILEYETKLKDVIVDLLSSFSPQSLDSPLGRIITSLQKQNSCLGDEDIMKRVSLEPDAFKNDLLVLLADLHIRGDLPALLFNFDRHNCEILARHLNSELEQAEEKWRSENPAWLRKMKEWEAWKSARERAERKAKKRSKEPEDPRDAPEMTWHDTFDPKLPSPQFSFIGRCATYSVAQLEEEIKAISWAPIPLWAFTALRRGIAVHHSGMNKRYRNLVENLFRKGFIRVIIATGTLALGINAPAKTSVFVGDSPFLTALMYRQCAGRAGRRGFDLRGNVIFYGLPLSRARRLVLSRLPTLGGNFPLTSTMTLRLFNLLNGSGNAAVAVQAVKGILSLPQITMNTDFGQDQLLHHIRFSVEYLRRSALLDSAGIPVNYAAVAAHLHYTEPSNLALTILLKSRVLHDICNKENTQTAKNTFMLIMCNLFGRRYLSDGFSKDADIKNLASQYPSMIILPPLPEEAREVLVAHDEDILQIFQGYASLFSAQILGLEDNALPFSRIAIGSLSEDAPGAQASCFYQYLIGSAIPLVVRSPFVANSGHGDSFKSISELTRSSRAGLNLNHHAIPTMASFIGGGSENHEHRLNAYLFDFYCHGQATALVNANCIRRGDLWYLLQDFMLTLKAVLAALEQLMTNTHQDGDVLDLAGDDDQSEDSSTLWEDDKEDTEKGESVVESANWTAISGTTISAEDERLLAIIRDVCNEFDSKFKKMWA